MLTPRQKAILHRAIDEARAQGSAKYVDEFGLPLDVVAYVAMYEGIDSGVYEAWDGPFENIHSANKNFNTYYCNKGLYVLEPYMFESNSVDSPEYDGSYFRPAAKGPILVVLQKIWDMSRNKNRNKELFRDVLKQHMHKLVDTL